MKRDKNFFYILSIIIFIIAYTISLVLACRTIQFSTLTLSGAVLVYPITYLILVLFSERYGKEKCKMMIFYAILALIAMVIFITISSFLPVKNRVDGLEPIFNLDFRIVIASLLSFTAGQLLCLEIYYFLAGFRGFRFLMAGVIAVTVDTLIFITLSNVGLPTTTFANILQLFTSQYIIYVVLIIIYSIIFTYAIDFILKKKKEELPSEDKKKKIIKKTKVKTKPKKES